MLLLFMLCSHGADYCRGNEFDAESCFAFFFLVVVVVVLFCFVFIFFVLFCFVLFCFYYSRPLAVNPDSVTQWAAAGHSSHSFFVITDYQLVN